MILPTRRWQNLLKQSPHLFVALQSPQHRTRQRRFNICLAFWPPPPATPSCFPLTERELTKGLFILNAFITYWISLLAEQCNHGTCFRGEQQVRMLDLVRVFRISIQRSLAVFTFAAGEKVHIWDIVCNMWLIFGATKKWNAHMASVTPI